MMILMKRRALIGLTVLIKGGWLGVLKEEEGWVCLGLIWCWGEEHKKGSINTIESNNLFPWNWIHSQQNSGDNIRNLITDWRVALIRLIFFGKVISWNIDNGLKWTEGGILADTTWWRAAFNLRRLVPDGIRVTEAGLQVWLVGFEVGRSWRESQTLKLIQIRPYKTVLRCSEIDWRIAHRLLKMRNWKVNFVDWNMVM